MKPLQTEYCDRDMYAERQLEDAAAALQNASLVLGTPMMRHWISSPARRRTSCGSRASYWPSTRP